MTRIFLEKKNRPFGGRVTKVATLLWLSNWIIQNIFDVGSNFQSETDQTIFEIPPRCNELYVRVRPLAWFHFLQNVNVRRDSIYCKTRQWKILSTANFLYLVLFHHLALPTWHIMCFHFSDLQAFLRSIYLWHFPLDSRLFSPLNKEKLREKFFGVCFPLWDHQLHSTVPNRLGVWTRGVKFLRTKCLELVIRKIIFGPTATS